MNNGRKRSQNQKLDPCDILHVDKTTSDVDLRSAYRAAMRRAHPDAGGTAGLAAIVSDAYQQILTERRQEQQPQEPAPSPVFVRPQKQSRSRVRSKSLVPLVESKPLALVSGGIGSGTAVYAAMMLGMASGIAIWILIAVAATSGAIVTTTLRPKSIPPLMMSIVTTGTVGIFMLLGIQNGVGITVATALMGGAYRLVRYQT